MAPGHTLLAERFLGRTLLDARSGGLSRAIQENVQEPAWKGQAVAACWMTFLSSLRDRSPLVPLHLLAAASRRRCSLNARGRTRKWRTLLICERAEGVSLEELFSRRYLEPIRR